tara:strand:- start:219 stop:587 length:369 start_codon:yes stop_codon:yes gene_type:complete
MSQKVLIVDDDPNILDLLKNRLESQSYDVTTCENAINAMETVEKENPNLIILDIMMPGIEGTKLCWILKKGEKYNKIPVIIISAKESSDVKRAKEIVGADAFLTKPFEAEELLAKARELLQI